MADHLPSFTPKPGDAVFMPAGTVHSLGDVVVFEVQENSDVTFRLYDWDRDDPKTGKPRPLQVDQALACIDYAQGAIGPVEPVVEATKPVLRERLFAVRPFPVWRTRGESPFTVGAAGAPRVLVCIDGDGRLEHDGTTYAIGKGDVMLLPAVVGACVCPADRGCRNESAGNRDCRSQLNHEEARSSSIWMARSPKANRPSTPRWRHCCATSSASSRWR